MMVTVEFLGPINKESMQYDVSSIKELKEILNQDESLKEWLINCAVALNDEIVSSLEIELKDGDRISLLPPVCGG